MESFFVSVQAVYGNRDEIHLAEKIHLFCSHASVVVDGCDEGFCGVVDYFADVVPEKRVAAGDDEFNYSKLLQNVHAFLYFFSGKLAVAVLFFPDVAACAAIIAFLCYQPLSMMRLA